MKEAVADKNSGANPAPPALSAPQVAPVQHSLSPAFQSVELSSGFGMVDDSPAPRQQSSELIQFSGGGDAVHEAAAHGISGPSTTLPHFDAIQQSFGGHDVSGVEAHVGGAAEVANTQMGSLGFATGNHVSFKSDPDLHTAAHEAAHVVQQRQGVQLKGGVGQVGDPYERHADAVADLVVQGKSAEPLLSSGTSGGEHGAVQHQVAAPVQFVPVTGNPRERTNQAGAVVTTHASPTMADSINHTGPAASGAAAGQKDVQVVAGESNKLRLGPGVCPVPERIYREPQQCFENAPAGYTRVQSLDGTTDAPKISETPDPGLFINGQPTADDVQQMGIGDCYFLALTMSVVARDPNKIKSMMTPDGRGGATVTFYKRTVTQPNWFMSMFGAAPTITYEPVQVQVSDQLAFNANAAGVRTANATGGFQVHGAQLRSAPQPQESAWWSKVNADKLEVHRDDTYQVARWAPLLEKAYARFSEVHGQYGGSQGEAPATGSGYNDINGGWSQNSMFVFYGEAADMGGANAGNVQQQQTTWAPGAQVLAANPRVVDQLLLLAGRGEQAAPTDTNAPIVTTTSMVHLLIPRLQAAIPVAQADPDYTANVTPATQGRITAVANAITAYNATPNAPAPPKQVARAAIGTACSQAVLPANAADLHNPARTTPIKSMLELMVDLKNIGTDASPGQRNIYGDHVYSVVGVNFCTTTGVVVPLQSLPSAQRPVMFPVVDTNVSTVRLRNPHHNNEPDMQGNNTPTNAGDGAPSGAAADGIFTMTVEQFFRNFTSVESGVLPRT